MRVFFYSCNLTLINIELQYAYKLNMDNMNKKSSENKKHKKPASKFLVALSNKLSFMDKFKDWAASQPESTSKVSQVSGFLPEIKKQGFRKFFKSYISFRSAERKKAKEASRKNDPTKYRDILKYSVCTFAVIVMFTFVMCASFAITGHFEHAKEALISIVSVQYFAVSLYIGLLIKLAKALEKEKNNKVKI